MQLRKLKVFHWALLIPSLPIPPMHVLGWVGGNQANVLETHFYSRILLWPSTGKGPLFLHSFSDRRKIPYENFHADWLYV